MDETDGETGADARTTRAGVVDAFAAEPLAGAPVGVVPDAGDVDDGTARALARELGGGGTAFVDPADGPDASRRLRYVPAGVHRGDRAPASREADPGDGGDTAHSGNGETAGEDAETEPADDEAAEPPIRALVAAGARLLADDRIDPGDHAVETAAGVVDVSLTADGVVWVDRPERCVETVDPDYDRVGDALGIDPAALRDVGADLSTAVASVGRPFLVVPVNFLSHLSGADPDGGAVAALADTYDVAGVYPVTFDAVDADATLHARCFCPTAGGAFEDPVTGAAAGAAGAYLGAVDAFDGDPPEELRVEQGYFVDRPGVVRVRVTDGGVRVGGGAVAALDGRATLPAGDDDDILVA
ncbi:MAG: PhzF family phenazine biosynthesis protein [Haloferacaceae archaeon]